MNDIICPNCKKAFKIDQTGYTEILKQVRDQEFQQNIADRMKIAEREKQAAIELAIAQVKNELMKDNQAKDILLHQRNAEIDKLTLSLASKDRDAKLELMKAIQSVERERDELKFQIQTVSQNVKESYEIKIKTHEDTIQALREMKAKLSTKMVGETLEQHCETEFNKIRTTAFPNAYFEKDNDASGGTKGDYIFRERDDSDNEIISIMFEMKNMAEGSTTKKNDDFLKKLDSDRKQKNCEYAVLVSMLEPDNDYYNTGIVISHQYDKMLIIRPQFFIQTIGLLRNSALNALKYKKELTVIKSQNIDITKFEQELSNFKTAFGRNYDLASKQFDSAIAEIDKSILHMERTKANLLSAKDNLGHANNKAENISIKKLTKGNKTMQDKFLALKDQNNSGEDILG